MKMLDLICTRRSIRKYVTDELVDEESIEKLLKAAMYAPSAVNKQPWHFIVFNSDEVKEQIILEHPNAKMMRTAAANILVCWDEQLEHDKGYGIVDCSAATQNILLEAHSMGIGTCWIGIYPREHRMQVVSKIFQLPAHIKPLAVVSVGYPDEQKTTPERFKPERIHYEKW